MHISVHPNSIARASLNAKPAVNTPQRVDLVPHRKFFDMRIGRLTRFNIDTLRRTRGRTKKARSASNRRVFPQSQPMTPAKIIGVPLPLIRILSSSSSVNVLLKPKQMRRMQKKVPQEMIIGNSQPTQNLRQINPLPKRHFLASFHYRPAPDPLSQWGYQRCTQEHPLNKIDGL
jgi:hypothetical protein